MRNMTEASIWTIVQTREGATVVLKPIEGDIGVPIFIDAEETRILLRGYDEKPKDRPYIHDVFLEIMRQLGLALFQIEVHDIKNDVFYARFLFSGLHYDEKKPLMVDGRPGDCFALAIRSKCPIFVSRKVAEQAGVPTSIFMGGIKAEGDQRL